MDEINALTIRRLITYPITNPMIPPTTAPLTGPMSFFTNRYSTISTMPIRMAHRRPTRRESTRARMNPMIADCLSNSFDEESANVHWVPD